MEGALVKLAFQLSAALVFLALLDFLVPALATRAGPEDDEARGPR